MKNKNFFLKKNIVDIHKMVAEFQSLHIESLTKILLSAIINDSNMLNKNIEDLVDVEQNKKYYEHVPDYSKTDVLNYICTELNIETFKLIVLNISKIRCLDYVMSILVNHLCRINAVKYLQALSQVSDFLATTPNLFYIDVPFELMFRTEIRSEEKWNYGVIKYLCQINQHIDYNELFEQAYLRGHFKIIKYLIHYHRSKIEKRTYYGLLHSINRKQFKIIEYIIMVNPKFLKLNISEILERLVRDERYKTINYLLRLGFNHIPAFHNLCLSIIKFSVEPSTFNLFKCLYEGFYLEHVKLETLNEYLVEACLKRQFYMIKFLIKAHNYDITQDNHSIFKYACSKNFVRLAVWLCEVNSQYSVDLQRIRFGEKINSYHINEFDITKLLKEEKYDQAFEALQITKVEQLEQSGLVSVKCLFCHFNILDIDSNTTNLLNFGCHSDHIMHLDCAYLWYSKHACKCLYCQKEFRWVDCNRVKLIGDKVDS